MVTNILCFGDSNTFGYIAGSGERYPRGVRWTSVLAELLGCEYKVFEGGCNNRACFVEHLDGEKFIGKKFITKYVKHNIDIIVSAIGSNDLHRFYKPSKEELEQGFEEYINVIKSNFDAKIIIFAPPLIKKNVLNTHFNYFFDEKSVEDSKLLPEIWKNVADKTGCYYLDLNDKVSVSDTDGLHFDEVGHKTIAHELAEFIGCSCGADR